MMDVLIVYLGCPKSINEMERPTPSCSTAGILVSLIFKGLSVCDITKDIVQFFEVCLMILCNSSVWTSMLLGIEKLAKWITPSKLFDKCL